MPVFIATPTSACASAGASFVPSPVIATRGPPACSRLISAILSSGVASARKSSTPASSAIALAVSGLSPVIITVRMPIAPQLGEALADALLDDVLEMDDAERAAVLGDDERRPARGGDAVDGGAELEPGCSRPAPRPSGGSSRRRPCGSLRPSTSTPLMRVCAVNGTSSAPCSSRPRRPYRSFASTTIERPSGVSSARLESWAASASSSSVTPGSGMKSVGLAVAERDRAGLVEQQRRAVARPPRPRGRSSRARCAARAGPCRRCRWRRAARRSSSGSGRRAARSARSPAARRRSRRRTAAA